MECTGYYKDVKGVGMKDVYVCTFQEFKSLCGILRQMILSVAWAQKSQENKGTKIHELYNYFVGPDFAKEVERASINEEKKATKDHYGQA